MARCEGAFDIWEQSEADRRATLNKWYWYGLTEAPWGWLLVALVGDEHASLTGVQDSKPVWPKTFDAIWDSFKLSSLVSLSLTWGAFLFLACLVWIGLAVDLSHRLFLTCRKMQPLFHKSLPGLLPWGRTKGELIGLCGRTACSLLCLGLFCHVPFVSHWNRVFGVVSQCAYSWCISRRRSLFWCTESVPRWFHLAKGKKKTKRGNKC